MIWGISTRLITEVICEQRVEGREKRRDSKGPRLLHSPRKYDSEDGVVYSGHDEKYRGIWKEETSDWA